MKVKQRRKATLRGKTKTFPYDVAEQLRTPEEMAAYLDAWLSDFPEDSAGIARAIGDVARAKGMSQLARDTGLSRESLYKALSDTRQPELGHGATSSESPRPPPARCGRVSVPTARRLPGKQPSEIGHRSAQALDLIVDVRPAVEAFDQEVIRPVADHLRKLVTSAARGATPSPG